MIKEQAIYTNSKLFTALFTISILALLTSCGGPKKSSEVQNTSCIPNALKFTPRDNGVTLEWSPNCGSDGAARGYQFYIVPDSELTSNFPNDAKTAHNNAPYPGDTNPENQIETAKLHSLLNGVPYTAVVRNLLSDGKESKPSNIIKFTPMPSGEFTLQIRYKGENDGFDLATASAQRADNALNDLYFASSSKGEYLASPSKLSFGLKSTRFQKVGNFKSLADASGSKSSGSKSDEVKISVGDVFDALTENNHYARIRVAGLIGEDKDRTITLEYLYQSIAGANSF